MNHSLSLITHPLYVHRDSNHPPSKIKDITLEINKRLNEISSNQESFGKAAPAYQHALGNSRYSHQLRSEETSIDKAPNEKKTRRRSITWYNPPFSKNVSANVGKKFLNVVKQSFPSGHKNTLIVSYSYMPSLNAKISAHNKSLLSKVPPTPEIPHATVGLNPTAHWTKNA